MNRFLLSAFLLVCLTASGWSQVPGDTPAMAGGSPNPTAPALEDPGAGPVTEPALPQWSDTRHESQAKGEEPQGYYPTSADLLLLGDSDYRRSGNLTQHPPDFRQEGSMGLYEYESGPQDFFTRNQDVLQPADHILGWFTPHKALTTEFGRDAGGSAILDANFPVFTRTLSPDKSSLKLGPLAFDLLWIGTGFIWSDFSGDNAFPDDSGDGWTGFIELASRGYLQFTESLHITWLANLVYLPWENELALRNGYSSIPSISADLLYQFRVAKWDFIVFNRFFARPGIDIFADLDQEGVDRAGRYQFGFYDRRQTTSFLDEDFAWFVNQAGLEVNRMFFDTDWRFRAEYNHWDMWRTFSFEDHTTRDTLIAQLGYEGNNIPFAPMVSYMGSTYDGFDSFVHRVFGTLTGRITDNVRTQVMGGYFWTDNFERENQGAIWSAALIHDFSRNGQHSLTGGQNIMEDSFSPESVLTQYIRYNLTYRLAQRLQGSFFAQHSDGERLFSASDSAGPDSDFNFFLTGLTLNYRPLDFTNIVARAAYQRTDSDTNIADQERWLYRLQVMQRLASRLVFETFYQFEDVEGAPNFDEHAVGASLRWFF